MADTTQDQVERARERVDRLNEEIAREKAKAAALATSNVTDLRVAQLNAEGDRLQQELDALRTANDVSVQNDVVQRTVDQSTSGITASGATTGGDATGTPDAPAPAPAPTTTTTTGK